jgi:TRAP transporter TAXI family solute receptor
MRRQKIRELPLRTFWNLLIVILVVLSGIFWLSFHFVRPIPPRTLRMTTGMEGGSYAVLGMRYRQVLARNEIQLQLLSSSGSVENLMRLRDESKPVDAGFVQGGIGRAEPGSRLMSLGSVFYSPLWVFYRAEAPLDDLAQLKGKRISIGPEGSGVRKLSLDLLKTAGASEPPTELYEYALVEAGKAMRDKRLDAVMTFGSADSALVMELIKAPDIRLMSFSQAEAYTRFFPNLSHVVLPKGIFDPSMRLPPDDIHLLAPTTNLIVRSTLHPALVYLLLEAAAEIHSGAGWVSRAGEFPALKTQDFPISDQAERYFKIGPSVLYDYLPFWAATFLDRMTLLLIPLAVVLIPGLGMLPWIYTWRNRSKTYRWYQELRQLDAELIENRGPDSAAGYQERLDKIEEAVRRIRVATAFYDEIFLLQEHISAVRQKLPRSLRSLEGGTDSVHAETQKGGI